MFLIDESGSIGETNFKNEKSFVGGFINAFPTGLNYVQIAVATYSTHVYNRFHLNQFQNRQAILKRIDSFQYHSGYTNTSDALKFAIEELFVTTHGDRPGVPNFLFVVTDGDSLNITATIQVANQVHSLNIKTFAINVGNISHSLNELNLIALDSHHVFNVKDISNALSTLKVDLKNMTCSGMQFLFITFLVWKLVIPILSIICFKTFIFTITPSVFLPNFQYKVLALIIRTYICK